MPQHPTAPRPVPAAPAPAETTQPGPSPAKKAADLTINKVLAGAGAAATTAVLGSYFGAAGTVAGAALGSVASTLSTTLYQRSLDRTRDTIVARVRITPGRSTDAADAATTELTVPMPRVSPEAATTRLRVEPALRRPRRVWMWLGVTVLVFLIGLLAVTGIEWAKGSTLTTGQAGTSVGRVLAPASGPDAADEGGSGDDAGSSESDGSGTDSDTDRGSDRDSDTGSDTGSEESGGESATDESGTDGSSTPSVEPTEDPAPTDEPQPTATTGEGDRAGSEGDALPTPVVPVPAEPRNG
jgi:hypothetical protein